MTDELLYPLVVCPKHGDGKKPGYIVCVHILDDAAITIAHMQTPTNDQLGEVLCISCYEDYQDLDRLKLICADCVHQLIKQREFRT